MSGQSLPWSDTAAHSSPWSESLDAHLTANRRHTGSHGAVWIHLATWEEECEDEQPPQSSHGYSHIMPSIALCCMNLMLDSRTSAPVDSTNESPWSFFSITTSSGSPKPDTQERVNRIKVCVC